MTKSKFSVKSGTSDASPTLESAPPPTEDLRPGDYVRVRPGVRDPDFEGQEIGGWTGRVTWVGKNRGPKTHVTIMWDRRTRASIPIEIKRRCDEEGVGLDEMDLDQEDLERIDPPEGTGPGSLSDLLDQMEDDGDWPAPDTLAAILAKGPDAIESLREIVRCGCLDPDAAGSADVAAGLLADLKATAAVPDLLRFLREGDEDALDWVADALVSLSDGPLSDVAQMISDEALDVARRGVAIHVCMRLVHAMPNARASLVALLTNLLSNLIARAKEFTMAESELLGNLVMTLSHLAAPEARPLIDAAFEANIIEEWIISREDVERNYRAGGKPSDQPPRTFLAEYRERYDEPDEGDEYGD